MRLLFIILGILLLFWGAAAVVIAVEDIGAGVTAAPRQAISYAAAFLVGGGVLLIAGVKRYALNRMFMLGAVLLHAAVYHTGALLESSSREAVPATEIAVTIAFFMGAMICFQRAHRRHQGDVPAQRQSGRL